MTKKMVFLLWIGSLLTGCTLTSLPAPSLYSISIPTPAETSPAMPGITEMPRPSPAPATPPPAGLVIKPVTTHPRLWITAADLPRLRAWAAGSNPLFAGLEALVEGAKQDMDAGKMKSGDNGGYTSVDYPNEMVAELFAFFSLIDNNPAARQDYASRAHTLLMDVIAQADKGAQVGQPFRDPEFSTNDRSRWTGEGFALSVDWIYPSLSKEDKAKIRRVFLRWVGENQNAEITSFNHPVPVGVVNDPILVSDRSAMRYSLNNYYTAHMRNIGLMSMALDPADDPDGSLTGALKDATGAWLYVVDYALHTDARGGLTPEGMEYGHQSLSYVLQFLLALHTAGQDDPRRWGAQVWLDSTSYWNDMITAYNHSISPSPLTLPDIGTTYQPSWYGDGQEYRMPDLISAFGALGIYDQLMGNAWRLNALRWWEMAIPAGGAAGLAGRVSGANSFTQAILYFMLFDPSAPKPTDPRSDLPLFYLSQGIGRLFSRSSWAPDAAWFQFSLGWNRIDHQDANGNCFGFYRNGEWLTKERMGYANIAEGIASSEFCNTLSLRNNQPPDRDPSDWRYDLWQRGSQWNIVASGDPTLIASSDTSAYTYALGDSTNLYNSTSESSTDILHASRSILWLKPDFIIIYDRAISKTEGRFKRFWLQLPEKAQVAGAAARMLLPSGQQLFTTSLLPQGAVIQPVDSVDSLITQTAAPSDPMKYRVKIEAPGNPREARFLTVLQGADPNAPIEKPYLIKSSAGIPYEGALIRNTLVLFPVSLAGDFSSLTFLIPSSTKLIIITGLTLDGQYEIAIHPGVDQLEVTIKPGNGSTADGGGILSFKSP